MERMYREHRILRATFQVMMHRLSARDLNGQARMHAHSSTRQSDILLVSGNDARTGLMLENYEVTWRCDGARTTLGDRTASPSVHRT